MVLTQILSHFIKFGPWITNSIQFWWSFGKSAKKKKKNDNDNYMDTTAMRMENERTFQVFSEIFQFLLAHILTT